MSPELDRALCEAHPRILRNYRRDIRARVKLWGFECADGWHGIVSSLCVLVDAPYTQARQHYEELVAWRAMPSGQPQRVVSDDEVLRAQRKMVMAERNVPIVALVKVNFGALRIQMESEDARTTALIEFAEHHSRSVCEECGAPGRLREGAWPRTLCDAHAARTCPPHEPTCAVT